MLPKRTTGIFRWRKMLAGLVNRFSWAARATTPARLSPGNGETGTTNFGCVMWSDLLVRLERVGCGDSICQSPTIRALHKILSLKDRCAAHEAAHEGMVDKLVDDPDNAARNLVQACRHVPLKKTVLLVRDLLFQHHFVEPPYEAEKHLALGLVLYIQRAKRNGADTSSRKLSSPLEQNGRLLDAAQHETTTLVVQDTFEEFGNIPTYLVGFRVDQVMYLVNNQEFHATLADERLRPHLKLLLCSPGGVWISKGLQNIRI